MVVYTYMTVIRKSVINRGLLFGFLFGAIVAPVLASLGILLPFFEMVRPWLVGPMDVLGRLIPDIQISSNAFLIPWYKWVASLVFNGLCYALLGMIVQNVVWLLRRKK